MSVDVEICTTIEGREAEKFFSYADYLDRAIGRLCAVVVVVVLVAAWMGWL